MANDEQVFVESKPYMIVLSKGQTTIPIKTPAVVKEIKDALKRGLGLGPGTYPVTLVIE